MLELADARTIVLLGAWNRGLLTPQWVGEKLLGNAEVSVKASIGIDTIITQITGDDVSVIVEPSKLRFSPNRLDDAAEAACLASVEAVLDLLHHTPILGIGNNFGFVSEAQDGIAGLFDADDTPRLTEFGAISSRSIKRSVVLDRFVLNVELVEVDDLDGINVMVNAHYENAEGVDWKEVGRQLKDTRVDVERIISSVYGDIHHVDA